MSNDKFYLVHGKRFENKVEALAHSSKISCSPTDVKFYYHHDAWTYFDKSQLGRQSLSELYKQRAQQLRDKYDYLILYFSGGADSTNILQTFLNNNIKLDEVVVRWPKKLIGSNLYIPNSIDQSARNFVSEWDLVIEKELKTLRSNHPKIKITILDYVEDIPKGYYNDLIFTKQNHMHSAVNLLRMQKFTDIELNPKGKKVCAIAGVDKPMLVEHNSRVFMFFLDDVASLHTKTEEAYREDFYWTPDFPEIAYEMAYQVFLYFKLNPLTRQFLPKAQWNAIDEMIRYDGMQYYYRLIKPIIYGDTWDMRKFQADKPFQGFKADKDFWFYESTDFERAREQWRHYYDSQMSVVDEKFCLVDHTGKKTGYKPVFSPLYLIGEFG